MRTSPDATRLQPQPATNALAAIEGAVVNLAGLEGVHVGRTEVVDATHLVLGQRLVEQVHGAHLTLQPTAWIRQLTTHDRADRSATVRGDTSADVAVHRLEVGVLQPDRGQRPAIDERTELADTTGHERGLLVGEANAMPLQRLQHGLGVEYLRLSAAAFGGLRRHHKAPIPHVDTKVPTLRVHATEYVGRVVPAVALGGHAVIACSCCGRGSDATAVAPGTARATVAPHDVNPHPHRERVAPFRPHTQPGGHGVAAVVSGDDLQPPAVTLQLKVP